MKKRFVFINFKRLIHQFLKNKKRRMIQSSEKLINFLLYVQNEQYFTEINIPYLCLIPRYVIFLKFNKTIFFIFEI